MRICVFLCLYTLMLWTYHLGLIVLECILDHAPKISQIEWLTIEPITKVDDACSGSSIQVSWKSVV